MAVTMYMLSETFLIKTLSDNTRLNTAAVGTFNTFDEARKEMISRFVSHMGYETLEDMRKDLPDNWLVDTNGNILYQDNEHGINICLSTANVPIEYHDKSPISFKIFDIPIKLVVEPSLNCVKIDKRAKLT